MVIGRFQQETTGRIFESRIGARNTVPSSAARIVAFGDRQSCFRPYSSCRWRLGVIVAHFTPTCSRRIASAARTVTWSSVASRFGRHRS